MPEEEEKLTAKTARLINASRLTDCFLTTQTYISPDEPERGQLLFLMEIAIPWLTGSQIGQTIINTFKRTYYRTEDTSDLVNFETAIKKVNETLSGIAQNGDISWIGKLNALIGLYIQENLIITRTGTSQAWLIREQKLSHLTKGTEEETPPHPLKTFIDVFSGKLKDRDWLILGTESFFQTLPISEIKEIILGLSPSGAATEATKILQKQKIKKANALFFATLNQESLASQPLDELPEAILIDQSSRRFGETLSWLATAGQFIWRSGKKYLPIIAAQLLRLLRFSQHCGRLLGRFLGHYIQHYIKRTTKPRPLVGQTLYTVKEYQRFGRRRLKLSLPQLVPLINYWRAFWQWSTAKNNRSKVYLIITLIIMLILTANIFLRQRRHNSQQTATSRQQITQEIMTKYQAIQIAGASQQNNPAAWKEILDLTAKTEEKNLDSDEVRKALAAARESYNRLAKNTNLSTTEPKITFARAGKIYLKDDRLLTFNPNNNEVYQSLLAGGQPQTLATVPNQDGLIKIAGLDEKNNRLLIVSFLKNLRIVNLTDNKLSEVIKPEGGDFHEAAALEIYGGHLYLLATNQGKIWKYPAKDSGFGAAEQFIEAKNSNLSQGVDLAIDGEVYVLDKNGQVNKFRRNQWVGNFKLKGLPLNKETISRPLRIYTKENIGALYILDDGARRVVKFDKEGNFLSQYTLPKKLTKLQDLAVSEATGRLFLLADDRVYEWKM